MAKGKKLKVFRTPIGFHDAYVAAPSQKAALQAWGADGNLFAQGVAEQVTEENLMKAPLASPGEVIRVARGSAAEHVRALGRSGKTSAAKGKNASRLRSGRADADAHSRSPRPKAKKPSRAPVEKAERKLEAVRQAAEKQLAALREEEQRLAEKRRRAEARLAQRQRAAEEAVTAARDDYRQAMATWADEV